MLNKGKKYQLNDVKQYEQLIATIPVGVAITEADNHFTILFANPGFYDLLGYSEAEHHEIFQGIGAHILHPDEVDEITQSAERQLAECGSFHLKARLSHKTRGYIWAQFNGQICQEPGAAERLYVVLSDISEQLDTQRQLENEQAFTSLLSALSDGDFFDCDLLRGSIRFSKRFAQQLEIEEISSDYHGAFQKMGLSLSACICETDSSFRASPVGVMEEEAETTLPSGRRLWYRCRFEVIRDSLHTPVRIVGHLTDITHHKKQLDAITALAQLDQLTGLYHKAATEALIKESLLMRRTHHENCALFIIDVDNFKNINDKLGHLYGDVVLTQLAERLRLPFRNNDIVGRVGGDEFFVFMENYTSAELLAEKAQEICNLFHKTYSEGDTFVTISASIGIALSPKDSSCFDELYKKADAALYDAKARGKSGFSFYSDTLEQSYRSTRTEIDSNGMKKSFKDNRIEYVFRLLYDSENPVFSIQAVLQLVAESFGFSRGYIFEDSADGRFTSNTFEWCVDAITPQIKNLQSLPIESLASATDSFQKSGMFILKSVRSLPDVERRILEPQGILSMFQFGIRDQGKFVGFIGFDNCEKERIPTDTEIDEICTVCHVLSSFLLRQRSNERESLHHLAIETVMDNMSSLAYVIDPTSYVVLYENKNVLLYTGKPSLGEQCHLAYRGHDTPCVDCPLVHLSASKKRHTMEIYNEKYDLYVRTESSFIDWADSKTACLICSTDISEYKRSC